MKEILHGKQGDLNTKKITISYCIIYIQGVSSLRSLSPCTCVEPKRYLMVWMTLLLCTALALYCTKGLDCTVQYCTCSDLQFMFIPLACYIIV